MTKAVEAAVAKYIALRDMKQSIASRHKEELAPYNEAMAKIESAMQKFLLKQGGDSIKTGAGTAYITRVMKATVKDWPALREYVLENDMIDMLEHRVSKDAVEQFVDATGEIPPGVAIENEINTRFRR